MGYAFGTHSPAPTYHSGKHYLNDDDIYKRINEKSVECDLYGYWL